ncbi:GNAT family N-acetyltransferase [Rhodococcus artemisiae]|uniref:GNAT family N-acetyltransferase n=1 Tax=Rhodococcus artemisiae TaxID=714159 RepID=A0ABU7LI34_9NOCA|nr:GNAT family N-acetyltransferase [Rhodococcus artemisiae]MEE2061181.1 GNAT family N-acetyltransferase [Rhodococcus artemisiae]
MDPHLSSIAALAWCRELGLADDALSSGGLVTKVDDTVSTVRVLDVGDTVAVVGPARAASAVAALPTRSDEGVVRAAAGGFAARTEVLCLCPEWTDAVRVKDPLISHDTADLAELVRRCPPDDSSEVGADVPDRAFVLLDDDHQPLAVAGYRELQSLLADVRVLTTPENRRLGLGATVATLCTHDALDAGLIPQWRTRRDNLAARGLAAVSGYLEWGTLITVRTSVE